MTPIADGLRPDMFAALHPDALKNEEGYWAARDRLMESHRNQWIAFADGEVVASGSSPVDVHHDGEATGRRPFVICVGREFMGTRIRGPRSRPYVPPKIADDEGRPIFTNRDSIHVILANLARVYPRLRFGGWWRKSSSGPAGTCRTSETNSSSGRPTNTCTTASIPLGFRTSGNSDPCRNR